MTTRDGESKMDPRMEKGIQIAAARKLVQKGWLWMVPSQSHAGTYIVDYSGDKPTCSCPDHETRGCKCKHIFAVQITLEQGVLPDGSETTEKKVRITYTQNWTAYNQAQQREKEMIANLLRALCEGIQQPERKGAGRPRLPLADVVFGAVMKVYSTVSGRRAATDIREAQEKGLIDEAPHYNTIFRYLEDENLTALLEALVSESAIPLADMEYDFAVDSSGFSTSTYARWYDHKWGREQRKNRYVKAHLITGVKTHVVTRVIVTDEFANDSPVFKPLVAETAARFPMREISADKAYSSKGNLTHAASFGATPYIPFKSNVRGSKGTGLWRKMWHYFQFNRDEFLTHYHKRSNVETTFSMIKAKFGGNIRSKSETAQVNEILCKVICHNLCCLVQAIFEFGLEPKFWKSEDRVA